jgi:trehalose synthase
LPVARSQVLRRLTWHETTRRKSEGRPLPVPFDEEHDPETVDVLAECTNTWRELPKDSRARVSLVCLQTEDPDENAIVVNALQRHARVVVQKSLAEGFGLTVAEGMWKAKPVVASAVGGIVDQISPGTGVLLEEATDVRACGREVARLLGDPDLAASLGRAARARVLEEFVGDQHLAAYAQLMGKLHLHPR